MRNQKYASTSNKASIRPKFVANYSLVMKNLFTAASYVKNIINEFVIKVYNQEVPSYTEILMVYNRVQTTGYT